MIKKGLGILVVAFICRTFFSCCDCGGDSRPTSVDTMTLSVLNNSGEVPLEGGLSVPKEAFGIRMGLSASMLSDCNRAPLFFTAAYACDCTVFYRLGDVITTIQIHTVNDLNDAYPAGSDVTDLFRMLKNGRYISLEAYQGETQLTSVYGGQPSFDSDFFLLTVPQAGMHQFQLELEFDTGVTLTGITEEINLQ